jgi:hypothetical protein
MEHAFQMGNWEGKKNLCLSHKLVGGGNICCRSHPWVGWSLEGCESIIWGGVELGWGFPKV